MKKRVISLIIALSLISAPAYIVSAEGREFDGNEKSMAIIWDLLAVRPVSFIAMAAGAIIFVPAALITMIGGNEIEPIQDALLKGPYEYTIKRPLGQFE